MKALLAMNREFTTWTKAVVIGLGCLSGGVVSAHASYTIDIYQQGNNVVAQGSGSLNLKDIKFDSGIYTPPQGFIDEVEGFDFLVFSGSFDLASGFQTSGNVFGNAGDSIATLSSGSGFGYYESGYLLIPQSYSSGTEISAENIWDGTTLSAMGLLDGTETFSWGSGANADSLTIDVGTAPAVPEPSSYALFGLGALTLAMVRGYSKLRTVARRA